jgi:hypothetical protein
LYGKYDLSNTIIDSFLPPEKLTTRDLTTILLYGKINSKKSESIHLSFNGKIELPLKMHLIKLIELRRTKTH